MRPSIAFQIIRFSVQPNFVVANHFFHYLQLLSLIMKRRDFILSVVGGAGVVSVSAYYLFGNADYDGLIAQPKSLSMIWDDDRLKAIGKMYREQVPNESSERVLVKLLNEAGPGLEEKVASDFKTRKTVVVDGWVLSETEARQCALASLIQTK